MAPLPASFRPFLASSPFIDHEHRAVQQLAAKLQGASETDTVKRCFAFVRDEILHSGDHERNPVTLRASEVLAQGTGFCFAKSHLLAALLRVHGIPAALRYQRLVLDADAGTYCLHGLNAVYLTSCG